MLNPLKQYLCHNEIKFKNIYFQYVTSNYKRANNNAGKHNCNK